MIIIDRPRVVIYRYSNSHAQHFNGHTVGYTVIVYGLFLSKLEFSHFGLKPLVSQGFQINTVT